jgi:hypothetical protein
MSDDTQYERQRLLAQMPEELQKRVQAGEEVWDTEALRRDFTVLGFQAPFVVVERKTDGVRGSLMFTHQPRWYFGWQEDA